MITRLSAAELGRRMASHELSVKEVVDAHLDRIDNLDGRVGSFIHVTRCEAHAQAEQAQAMIDRGDGGPLTGVPIALKDNLSTEGVPTTCASRILDGYVPPFDATCVAQAKAAGMVLIGKTNLDEFAMGTSCENSAFHPTRNPWDTERSPGGSSGGSAAAVAAEFSPIALGSDTGGSIRMPASLCGVVGFKPTYGRVSRYGLVAFASSLDQVGPLARSVEDVALLSEAISGHDPLDSTSLKANPIAAASIHADSLKGKRIAIPEEMLGEAIEPGTRTAVEAAVATLQQEGVVFERVSLPSIRYGVTTYYIIAPAEASSNLARFDGIRYGPRAASASHVGLVERTRAERFGREVKSRIMIGTYALSAGYYDAYYVRAQQVRSRMRSEFESQFERFDAVLSPTSPIPAFRLGELRGDPMALKLLDLCTIPANMGGFPAISLNCGFSNGLPVGIHLMAGAMQDESLLGLAHGIERALPNSRPRAPFD